MWMPGARRRQRSGGSARRSWSRGAARGRPAGGSGAGCHPAGAPGSGGGGPWTAGGRDRDGESGCEFGIERGFAGGDLGEEGRGANFKVACAAVEGNENEVGREGSRVNKFGAFYQNSLKFDGFGTVRIQKSSNLLFSVSKFKKKDKNQQKICKKLD
jgi:hypothetical protein